ADTAAPAAGAAAVGHQRILLDQDRMLGLHHLDRHVGEILRWIGDGLDTVFVGPPAPGAADHVDDDERLAVLAQPADADHAVAALAGGGPAVWDDLRQRTQHGVEDAVTGERARRARSGQHRIEHRGFGNLHLDAAEHADIVRDLPAEHAANAQIGVGV